MNGIVVVDKPAGITSHDVVARVRRALGIRKVGHAGTLDPQATGVLVVGVGRATRLLRFLEAHDKEYVATIVFGRTTDTQDATGATLQVRSAAGLTREAVETAMLPFVGSIEQIPPMVSAVKVGGEPLYRAARRGEEVERAPRAVIVHAFDLTGYDAPRAQVRVVCSKGTYVRTLAADLGEALGVGAHLEALRRVRVGPFDVPMLLDDVRADRIRPMDDALAGYPRRDVDADAARDLVHGKPLPAAGIDGPYGVWGPDGLVAVCEDRGEEARSLCVLSQG